MSKLSVSYLGLNLKTPLVVGSSGLTDSAEKVALLAENGAGAVVLKSLFEEQINYEAGSMMTGGQFPEAEDYLMGYLRSNNVDTYLKLIEDCKKVVDIPVIASVNCKSAGEWISFAKLAEEAGADALELNLFFLPLDTKEASKTIEDDYFEIISKVKAEINIPIAVKIGQNFTNIPAFVEELYDRGAKSVVLFNRFYAPDININKLEFMPSEILSSPQEIRTTIRWVGLISSVVEQIDICASTGIHSGEAVIKQILAGAEAVQVCSVLYKNGPEFLVEMNKFIEEWMEKNTFDEIKQFRGRLNYKKIKDPSVFERSQFMKYYSDKK